MFKIGQRVRIKWSNGWPELAGQEATITSIRPILSPHGWLGDFVVAPDSWGSANAPHISLLGANTFAPKAEQLTPIVDDGWQVITWDACVVSLDQCKQWQSQEVVQV